MNLANEMLLDIESKVQAFIKEVQAFSKKLEDAGAPVILGDL
jgi:hypothetical protein